MRSVRTSTYILGQRGQDFAIQTGHRQFQYLPLHEWLAMEQIVEEDLCMP